MACYGRLLLYIFCIHIKNVYGIIKCIPSVKDTAPILWPNHLKNTINVALVQFLKRLHAKYGNEKQRLLLRSLKNFLHWKPIKTFNLLL